MSARATRDTRKRLAGNTEESNGADGNGGKGHLEVVGRVFKAHHSACLGNYGGQHHCGIGNEVVSSCEVQIVILVREDEFLGGCLVGGDVDRDVCRSDAVNVDVFYLVVGGKHGARDDAGNMACVAVSARAAVKVVEHIVKVALGGVNVYVVDVTLCAVEEDALNVVDRLFGEATCHSGPVCRDARAADNVGVVCKVDENESLLTLAVKAKHVYALVGRADGGDDIGVVDTGVGLCRAVLHAVTADKGNVLCLSRTKAHFSGCKVGNRKECDVLYLVREVGTVFEVEGVRAVGLGDGTLVGVGGVDVYVADVDACLFCDGFAPRGGNIAVKTAQVKGDENSRLLTVRYGESASLEGVEDLVGNAFYEIARNVDAERRGDINASVARLKRVLCHSTVPRWCNFVFMP